MIKDILVCLEGSVASARASELAIRVAKQLGAQLVGLAIVDEPDIMASQAVGIGGSAYKHQRDEALLADAHARASDWMSRFVESCRAAGVPARSLELRGRPGEVIVEELQRHDLTILGSSVNFRFETNEHDGTRDQILRRAERPTLLVPEAEPSLRPIVALAWDGSPAAERALRSFAGSGLARGQELHVITVGDDGVEAWEMAQKGCILLSALGLPAKPHKIVSLQKTPNAILDQVAKLEASMLVLGGYVPSRISRLFWGSITAELVEKSPVPLWIRY